MMRKFHLNCGTLYPPLGVCFYGAGSLLSRPAIVTHCILLEIADGLLLVDTGVGTRDLEKPDLFVRSMLAVGGSRREFRETALAQIRDLGYEPSDVKHIALTHFHFDHAGGLPDFPHAKVHLHESELEAIMHPADTNERHIYRRNHWRHQPDWVSYTCEGKRWFGFERTGMVDLGEISFCFIPLPGHTRGHAGVAIKLESGWLLHCGDAYTFHGEVDPENPREAPYAKTFRRIANVNYAFRNIGRHSDALRALVRDFHAEVTLTNSHDPIEFNKFAQTPL